MRVKSLDLNHFRNACHVTIDLDPYLNVFAGVNGSGKTTVIDALAILLSWAVARVRSAGLDGEKIREQDISNDKGYAHLSLTGQGRGRDLSWRLVQARPGRNPKEKPEDAPRMSEFGDLEAWADGIRDTIGASDAACSLPLFVCYPVGRAVLDIPLRIRASHRFDLLEAYDEALPGSANFRLFFEWYRSREDLENEQRADGESFVPDPQLETVRRAILAFLPEFSGISVRRNPLAMVVTKRGERLRVDQMSDGEKCLFAMIGDLARRLAIANPSLPNPLEGEGIVLIDEVDLHLHPSWQRIVVPRLRETFPNCQLILTTHSPQVLGEIEATNIRILSVEPLHGLTCYTPQQALGLDSSEIVEELMGASSRNHETTQRLEAIFRLIDEERFSEAKARIGELRDRLRGPIPEIVRAESLVTMLEPDRGDRQ